MGAEEWIWHGGKAKSRQPSLANWCDVNLTPSRFSKLSGLVAKNKAAEEVAAILKKYQQYGATIGPRLRRILEKELDGAGDWDAAASPPESSQSAQAQVRMLEKQLAAASAKLACRPTAQRGRSGGRAPDDREFTVVKSQRHKSSVAAAVDIPVDGEGGIPGEGEVVEPKPKPPRWTCPACATEHGLVPKKHCHLCLLPQVAARPMAQAATSAEEDAVEIAKLQGVVDALVALNSTSPADKAVINGCRAKITRLSKPRVPTPELPASVRHNAAMVAVETTLARNAALVGVQQALQRAIDQKQAALVRVAVAMARALEEHQVAEATLAAAARQLPAAAAGPAAAQTSSAAQAPPVELREVLYSAVQSMLLHAPGEAAKKEGLYTDATQAIDMLVARISFGLAAKAAPQPATAAAPAGAFEAGESCLPRRPDLKAESVAASRTQGAMHGVAKQQRAELRRQLAENARGTDAQVDAGDLADLSDNDPCGMADSCSRAPPGWRS